MGMGVGEGGTFFKMVSDDQGLHLLVENQQVQMQGCEKMQVLNKGDFLSGKGVSRWKGDEGLEGWEGD